MKNISFSEFVEKYWRIKDSNGNIFSPSVFQKGEIIEMEKKIKEGYTLKLIHGRGSNKVMWVKEKK